MGLYWPKHIVEQVIKKPMDLSLIRERIMSGALLSLDDMNRDLFVMCNNAMVFNGKGDPYFDYSKVCLYLSCNLEAESFGQYGVLFCFDRFLISLSVW